MKKVLLITLSIIMLFCTSIVFADAAAPEFPYHYENNSVEIGSWVFFVIAVIVIAIACTISIKANKKQQDNVACEAASSNETKE